ncbi:MAG TPA: hypothetical protein VNJ47_10500 [Nevskiales bacterium]|nr:hypothetical protein [Nevskiales bacterium]
MSFEKLRTEDRRLVILRLLAEIPGYECNSSILQEALDEYGHPVSRDTLHVDLAWLTEQQLLTVSEVATVKVAQLTARGLDVAGGRAVVPGVRRPGPRI